MYQFQLRLRHLDRARVHVSDAEAVRPEFSSQLIMLEEYFRKVIICRHEPGYFFRDLLPDGPVYGPLSACGRAIG